jgi:hypothetical protein
MLWIVFKSIFEEMYEHNEIFRFLKLLRGKFLQFFGNYARNLSKSKHIPNFD